MTLTLSTAYQNQLRKENTSNVIIEIALDGGTRKFGYHTGGFDDVQPVLHAVSSLQNKIDTFKLHGTRGQIKVTLVGRDNFRTIVKDEYLKNRRVVRKDGFTELTSYSDYADTFTGVISDWERTGDTLILTVTDDLYETTKKIPVENANKTQTLDYRNTHPVDIMQDILKTQLGISTSYVDDTQFDNEQSLWLSGWFFDRVLTTPKTAKEYLNELQIETNSFIIHDGAQITYKVFAPPVPGVVVTSWNDNDHFLVDSLSQKSGYRENFYNRVVVYFDYDESGGDSEKDYESAYIVGDSVSQSSTQWDETKSKVIKSKWIRSLTHTETTNITGLAVYHVSLANSTGSGTLTYNNSSNHLTWTAPNGTAGETVKLSKNGKFQIFDADKTKSIRVVVETSSLPVSDKADTATITSLNGDGFANQLAGKLLQRYRDPAVTIKFDIDINEVSQNGEFIKPTDLVDITSDEIFEKGDSSWTSERCMITAINPDFANAKVGVEAIETKMYLRYGFIAPAGYPDYSSASTAQRQYGFIGNSSNEVNDGVADVDGFYIW